MELFHRTRIVSPFVCTIDYLFKKKKRPLRIVDYSRTRTKSCLIDLDQEKKIVIHASMKIKT